MTLHDILLKNYEFLKSYESKGKTTYNWCCKCITLCDASILASKIWPEPQYYSLVLLKDASMAKLYSCFKDSIVFNLAR